LIAEGRRGGKKEKRKKKGGKAVITERVASLPESSKLGAAGTYRGEKGEGKKGERGLFPLAL